MPPGFRVTGLPAGRSSGPTARIFITFPDISISCNSALSATGVEAPVSVSPPGDCTVKYAAPLTALPGVARAQASLISTGTVWAATAPANIRLAAIASNTFVIPGTPLSPVAEPADARVQSPRQQRADLGDQMAEMKRLRQDPRLCARQRFVM